MKIYDTLSGKKKVLETRSKNKIEIFVCGPTVYDYSHIGHARTYIAFDSFTKYLRSKGYEVRYIQNITDIDDKIITRAKKTKQAPKELARIFETEYYHDMHELGIHSVDKYARATDYIPQIISQVERLIDKGYAYEIKDDGIYYDISKFKDYGKLSNRTVQQAEDAISRIDESINKRNRGDFALWKLSPSTNSGQTGGDPSWPSPWGEGRPGWHIEDTAITELEFGPQYDIHGGARDLIFPHHESEIAQMESMSRKTPLVNYWMHTGFLTVGKEKMAKSLGNFITIHKFLREHSRETLRLFISGSHYRSPIDYSERAVRQAETNARRLGEFKARLERIVQNNTKPSKIADSYRKLFINELDDDFNTPKALAVVFSMMRDINTIMDKQKIKPEDAQSVLAFLDEVNNIFGIIYEQESTAIPKNVTKLIENREEFRKSNDWDKADEIRQKIEKLGYTVKDTASGPKVVKSY